MKILSSPNTRPTSATTIEDVALEIGCSTSTVSRALRNDPRVSKATKSKIHAAAQNLGYRPNPLISALMSHLRTLTPVHYRSTIAYLDTSPNLTETEKWQSARQHYQGVLQQAERLGYAVDRFWFHDPNITQAQPVNILFSRGVQGLIIHYLPDPKDEMHTLSIDLEQFAVASLGARMRAPFVNYASIDHYAIVDIAVSELQKLGYRRIGLAIDTYAENIVEGRFLGAYLNWAAKIPRSEQIPYFSEPSFSRDAFLHWLKNTAPEVIICIDSVVLEWLEEAGIGPDVVGVVHLDWNEAMGAVAGVRQKHTATAAAAVDMVVGQLNRNERGVPENPKAVLLGGDWVPGKTVRVSP